MEISGVSDSSRFMIFPQWAEKEHCNYFDGHDVDNMDTVMIRLFANYPLRFPLKAVEWGLYLICDICWNKTRSLSLDFPNFC